MAFGQLLESFDSVSSSSKQTQAEINHAALEDERLASFESGYSAGWDDAIKAQAEDQSKVSSDLAQNLQEMSFTYHEALAHLNKSVEPLFQEIIEKILPQVAKATLGAQIVEQLVDLSRAQAQAPLEITVCPTQAEAVEAMLEDSLQQPFEIAIEPSLGEGQAYIKFGSAEREIDTTQVVDGIQDAVSAFIHQNNKEPLRARN